MYVYCCLLFCTYIYVVIKAEMSCQLYASLPPISFGFSGPKIPLEFRKIFNFSTSRMAAAKNVSMVEEAQQPRIQKTPTSDTWGAFSKAISIRVQQYVSVVLRDLLGRSLRNQKVVDVILADAFPAIDLTTFLAPYAHYLDLHDQVEEWLVELQEHGHDYSRLAFFPHLIRPRLAKWAKMCPLPHAIRNAAEEIRDVFFELVCACIERESKTNRSAQRMAAYQELADYGVKSPLPRQDRDDDDDTDGPTAKNPKLAKLRPSA
jgi:hypothetical protein